MGKMCQQRSISDMTTKSYIWFPVYRFCPMPRGPFSCVGMPDTLFFASGKLSIVTSGNYLECFIFCCLCELDVSFMHCLSQSLLNDALQCKALRSKFCDKLICIRIQYSWLSLLFSEVLFYRVLIYLCRFSEYRVLAYMVNEVLPAVCLAYNCQCLTSVLTE